VGLTAELGRAPLQNGMAERDLVGVLTSIEMEHKGSEPSPGQFESLRGGPSKQSLRGFTNDMECYQRMLETTPRSMSEVDRTHRFLAALTAHGNYKMFAGAY